jgi:predicted GNAT family acetyltransferase
VTNDDAPPGSGAADDVVRRFGWTASPEGWKLAPVLGTVVDETVNHRFVLNDNGEVAELVYRRNGRRLVLAHTGVPQALRGRGFGGRLVANALDQARADHLVLVPLCPYARQWLEGHPDLVAGVSIDWPSDEQQDTVAPGSQAEARGG